MRTEQKQRLATMRRWRVRKKVSGTPQRPRMAVRFSGQNIYVQFIDDIAGVTLASASTLDKVLVGKEKFSANVPSAKRIGAIAAEAAKNKGIQAAVFDRGAARYHGKVQALADAAREAGLKI